MKKAKATIEKWTKKHRATGTPIYYFHRVYANGNVGDMEKFKSRSGRNARVAKLKALEPGLVVKAKGE